VYGRSTFRHWIAGLVATLLVGSAPLFAQFDVGFDEIRGWAGYEKIPVTGFGLDPTSSGVRPIRRAVVEAVDVASGVRLAESESDEFGAFILTVPRRSRYRVQVMAVLASGDAAVLDNTQGGRTWGGSVEVEADLGPVFLLASEESHTAGAFNILDVLRRANAYVQTLEETFDLGVLTVFWSPLNTDDPADETRHFVGGTYFDPGRNIAVVLGDRSRDSDEFDDDVILHEYAHFLSALFRDESGGERSGPDSHEPEPTGAAGVP